MIEQQTSASETIVYDDTVVDEVSSALFSPAYWQQQKAIAGNATGRSTVYFIQQGDRGWVLRHYYRGGFIGKINHDRFLREPAAQSRAIQEFNLLVKLRDKGLPVPKPVAARYLRAGWFSYRADIIVEVIPGAVDVYRLLKQRQLSAEEWQTVGAAVRQLHQAQVFHSDLNCHNLMLDDHGKAWIVDFDKCKICEPGDWTKDNLARLLRSLRKEKQREETFHWKQSRDWPEFMTGYQQHG
ncbi:3-deoxy-D-manno-octulosonic acid kinase [Idiomarina tyrosinivorans]|uniref:3-deoxy-D-manno-octulosonic acid kinase n=1 Tax=Idiomarina tyrosinivorans TaxID=1445662 RepID=UPI001F543866|nr:3-deoxy-D-manno-octulosonic acid kinase [Idiomarina tyrosinivorans]